MYIILIFPFRIYTFFSPFLSWEPLNFRWGPKISGPRSTLAVKLSISFSLYIMSIILICSFHIYTFFSSFLSLDPLNFRWVPQNLGTQKHTSDLNIFFIVHHVHYFNMFFPHIYILFIFPILGAPKFPLGAPKSRNPEAHFLSNCQFKQFFCYFLNYTFVSILTFRTRIRSRFVFRVVTVSIIKFSDLGAPQNLGAQGRGPIGPCYNPALPVSSKWCVIGKNGFHIRNQR